MTPRFVHDDDSDCERNVKPNTRTVLVLEGADTISIARTGSRSSISRAASPSAPADQVNCRSLLSSLNPVVVDTSPHVYDAPSVRQVV